MQGTHPSTKELMGLSTTKNNVLNNFPVSLSALRASGFMKRHFFVRGARGVSAAASFLLLSSLLNVSGVHAAVKAKPIPPTAKQAIRLLLDNGSISLAGNASCKSVKQPGDNNLGDYLSSVLATQTDPTILWRTEVTTVLVKDRWQVDVRFRGKDQSDVYDMGLRFVTNVTKSTIDPKSISCIGTS
jgi:hypothetical protein